MFSFQPKYKERTYNYNQFKCPNLLREVRFEECKEESVTVINNNSNKLNILFEKTIEGEIFPDHVMREIIFEQVYFLI